MNYELLCNEVHKSYPQNVKQYFFDTGWSMKFPPTFIAEAS